MSSYIALYIPVVIQYRSIFLIVAALLAVSCVCTVISAKRQKDEASDITALFTEDGERAESRTKEKKVATRVFLIFFLLCTWVVLTAISLS